MVLFVLQVQVKPGAWDGKKTNGMSLFSWTRVIFFRDASPYFGYPKNTLFLEILNQVIGCRCSSKKLRDVMQEKSMKKDFEQFLKLRLAEC